MPKPDRRGYAVATTVPVQRTRAEIEELCLKNAATGFAYFTNAHGAMVAFEIGGLRLVFRLPLPNSDDAQDCRSRWRGLLLCIKAKFESVNRGVETFEEAFLAHVMTEDGRTVAEIAGPSIKGIISGNVPLLPKPAQSSSRDSG